MSTSDIEKIGRDKMFKRLRIYVFITLFFMVFGAVYEHFSHGIYSYRMIYAFAVPFVMWILPAVFLYEKLPVRISLLSLAVYDAAVITFTIGMIFGGVFYIFGSSNRYEIVYPIAGGILLIASFIIQKLSSRSQINEE